MTNNIKEILLLIQKARKEVEDIESCLLDSIDEGSEDGVNLSSSEIDNLRIESLDVNEAILELNKFLGKL